MSLRAVGSVLLLVFGAVTVQAGVTFSDDFNSGASPLWSNALGDWSASGGAYYAQIPSNAPPTYTLLPFVLTNLTLDVDINSVADGGIYLHSDNAADNGVVLITGGGYTSGTGLYWHIVTAGDWGPPYNAVSGVFKPGDSIHVTVTVVGDTYTAYLSRIPFPITTLIHAGGDLSGQVGLYDFSTQTFDNFVLSANEIPEPATLMLLAAGLLALRAVRRR